MKQQRISYALDAPHPLLLGDMERSQAPMEVGNIASASSAPTGESSADQKVLRCHSDFKFMYHLPQRSLIQRREPPKVPEPGWHAPWELSAVISGHLGWVRSIAFDASNEWFVTGSADRTIKALTPLLSCPVP